MTTDKHSKNCLIKKNRSLAEKSKQLNISSKIKLSFTFFELMKTGKKPWPTGTWTQDIKGEGQLHQFQIKWHEA